MDLAIRELPAAGDHPLPWTGLPLPRKPGAKGAAVPDL